MSTTKTADPPAEKKSFLKSKQFLIVVVLLVVAGVGYKFFLAAPAKPAKPAGGDVVSMDPTTLNLADGHYLKVGVAVQLVKGKATSTDFQPSHAMELVINEFTGRRMQALTNEERTKLTAQLGASIKKAYPGKVFTIFLTQFVVQ